jgi:hypothetical protein
VLKGILLPTLAALALWSGAGCDSRDPKQPGDASAGADADLASVSVLAGGDCASPSSVSVTPSNATIRAGRSVTYKAIVTCPNGALAVASGCQVRWTTADRDIAIVGAISGCSPDEPTAGIAVVSGVGLGMTEVSATVGGATGRATIAVNPL